MWALILCAQAVHAPVEVLQVDLLVILRRGVEKGRRGGVGKGWGKRERDREIERKKEGGGVRVVIGVAGAEDRRSKGYKSEESGCTVRGVEV